MTTTAKARAPSTFSAWWGLLKKAATAWSDDYAPSMGAALSYYTVFSLAPLLLLVISIAGLVFGQEAARGALFGQLSAMMGEDAAAAVQGLLASASKPSEGIIGTVIGVAVLILGATTVFGELQDALDRIWRAPARAKGGGLWGLVRTRFLSFGMILGFAFLLMVSLVMGAAIAALGKWWGPLFGGLEVLAQTVTFVVGFALTTVVFAMIYKLMPRVSVRWHDVWIGAAVTSLLFNVGRFLIGLYIGKSGVASGFGAAGSLIVVFVWVYYSAQIFLMGAEFTWVYARTFGSMKDLQDPATTDPVPTSAAAGAGGSQVAAERTPAAPVTEPRYRPAPVAAPTPAREDGQKWLPGIAVGVGLGLGVRYLMSQLAGRKNWA